MMQDAPEFQIDYEPGEQSELCPCGCGGRTVSLTRFIHEGDAPKAVYYARFATSHPERVVRATLSLGRWEEGTSADDRVAFAFEIRGDGAGYDLRVLDAPQSPWKDVAMIGRTLSLKEAEGHAQLKEAVALASLVLDSDVPVRYYFAQQG